MIIASGAVLTGAVLSGAILTGTIMPSVALTAVVLGIVEGLTEFLPVSSTGHLILATELLGYEAEKWALFTIAIQPGAIGAILVLYWRTFWRVLVGLPQKDPQAIAFTRNIGIALLPAVGLGLFLGDAIEALLANAALVAWALIGGGIAILLVERRTSRKAILSRETLSRGKQNLSAQARVAQTRQSEGVAGVTLRTSLMIGLVQCLALIPGVSRSGATILGAVAMGTTRKTAAEFSFFLAVPTLTGATALQLFKYRASVTVDDVSLISIGFVVSFLVAMLVVKAFVGIIARFGFAPFAWYRIVVGIAALLWLAAK